MNKNRGILSSVDETEIGAIASSELTVEFVTTIIESVVTEKRMQYRNQLGIEIDFILQKESYGLFLEVDAAALKAVLSNLIDNSVESLKENKGKIDISQTSKKIDNCLMVDISIKDNGIGIKKDLIPLLGKKGATFGKPEGNGLGLYSAFNSVNRWKGNIEIRSSENEGTSVDILMPLAEPPRWFLSELTVSPGSILVVLDDDQSIHSVWKGRMLSIKASEHDVKFVSISTPQGLRKFYGENFEILDRVIFLVDYELIGFKERGIDLIVELGIEKQSILVTSRFEEILIRQNCEAIGIKMVPKLMTTFLPISITAS